MAIHTVLEGFAYNHKIRPLNTLASCNPTLVLSACETRYADFAWVYGTPHLNAINLCRLQISDFVD